MDETNKSNTLRFYGGKGVTFVPLLMSLCILFWIALHNGNVPVYWGAFLFPLILCVFLAKDKNQYCEAIVKGIVDPVGGMLIISILLAGICGVIISASGMCDAGRIRHHLKHNLWRSECCILFVGYQSEGTLGRSLVDGVKNVKLFNEEIQVNATIDVLPGVSGHADKDGLIAWLQGFEKKPELVFVNHGDPDAAEAFTDCLNKELGYRATAPYSGSRFDLLTDQWEYIAQPRPIKRAAPKQRSLSKAFEKLLAAAERLLRVAKAMEGRPNKVLEAFAKDIDKLSDKMEK